MTTVADATTATDEDAAAAAHPEGPPPGAVLVTGAARRIGRAIALALGRQGWAVCVHYHRSAEAALDVVAAIQAEGGRAVALGADLAREAEVVGLIAGAAQALARPITGLINNASVFERDDALTATRASWDRHLEVNLRAPFVLSQELVANLPDGDDGAIVNILDQRVWRPTPFFTSYTVSKAGLWTLTQTLAMALAPRVRVNAIGPGPTLPSRRQTEAQFIRQWSKTPLARPVALDDITSAVRFLLAARAVTGQMIAVDSGQHLAWSGAASRAGPED